MQEHNGPRADQRQVVWLTQKIKLEMFYTVWCLSFLTSELSVWVTVMLTR